MASNMSQLGFSLISGQQETTIGLLQSKFDFSLVKIEAPPEYQGLGRRLSPKRKTEAEDGAFHITAQKLGALFVDDLPPIPKLKQAYGVRSSDIAENPKLNPNGNADHGPFAGHVGADGTSIWAAATSGPGALEVHLLACILARVWSSAEATSIWDELVSVRKQVLTERLNDERFHFITSMASRTDISRDRLAEWDASARSWLRIADKAMQKQQTQLMLIIENIGLPIASQPKVYDNVMLAWTKSLQTMEHLVSGVAQRIQAPEALLGLSSWHVYPDMIVLGNDTISIQQNDTLIQKGGVVTLGMRSPNSENDVGIMWTMPLAHLRFYGKPTQSAKSIGPGSSRVPFFRIIQVALGSAISQWSRSNSDFHKVCHLLISLDKRRDIGLQCINEAIHRFQGSFERDDSRNGTQARIGDSEESEWCKLFADQARSFLSAKEVEKKEFLRFVGLGKRLGSKFLAASNKHPEPVFGLSSIPSLLNLLDLDGQIKVLRHISTTFQTQFDAGLCLIVYHPVSDQAGDLLAEYATLVPHQYEKSTLKGHRRWLGPISRPVLDARNCQEEFNSTETRAPNAISPQKLFPTRKRGRDHDFLEDYVDYEPSIKRSISLMETTGEPCGFLGYQEIIWEKEVFFPLITKFESPEPLLHWKIFDNKPDFNVLKQCAKSSMGKLDDKKLIHGWHMGATSHQFFDMSFRRVLASDSVAVYQSTYAENKCNTELPIDYVQRTLDSELPRPSAVLQYFSRVGFDTCKHAKAYFDSLKALSRAATLYSTLPEADVQLEVVGKCLAETRWVQFFDGNDFSVRQPFATPRLKRSVNFACISLFDTGYVDLRPTDFDDVLGLSSPGSLYVSELLLNDPAQPDDSKIRCLIGNIGRPGLALLRSPLGPMFRKAEIESWVLVNHNEFDDRLEDNFRATSLQLTLTGSETPIDISRHAFRNSEVFYTEAIISAHDHGEWIGDINVLNLNAAGANHDPTLSEWLLPRAMPHTCNHNDDQKQDFKSFGPVVSIDNWWEYLDAPQSPSIVRAKGNYIARLAISAAQRQRGGQTILAKDVVCWACASHLAGAMKFDRDSTMIIC